MKLTKTKVEAEPIPASGQAFLWDDELRGFGVRITASGARSYIVQGRVGGKTRRVTLGAHGVLTCDEARRKARAALVDLGEGIDPQEEKKRAQTLDVTLRDVATDYCKNRRTKKGGALTAKTVRDIVRHLSCNFADWSDKPIVNITSDMCRDASRKYPSEARRKRTRPFASCAR